LYAVQKKGNAVSTLKHSLEHDFTSPRNIFICEQLSATALSDWKGKLPTMFIELMLDFFTFPFICLSLF